MNQRLSQYFCSKFLPVATLGLFFIAFLTGCSSFSSQKKISSPLDALVETSCPMNSILSEKLSPTPELLNSLSKSIEYLKRVDKDKEIVFGPDVLKASELLAGYQALYDWMIARKKDPAAEFKLIPKCFRPNTDALLLTGYYEGTLRGSLKQTPQYHVPVYAKPANLIQANLRDFTSEPIPEKFPSLLTGRVESKKFVPYYTRDEITFENKLSTEKPILWVDDELKLFFAHIQGSTVVQLPSGNLVYLGYDGHNGYTYKAIGRYMVQKGYIPLSKSGMQDILMYLHANPSKVREILSKNPSFIFFRKSKPGPFGCYSVALTPRHSVATDRSLFPAAALLFLSTTLPPDAPKGEEEKLNMLPVFNQDTGGAIKGTGRMDFFLGRGEKAEFQSGRLRANADAVFIYFVPN